MIHQFMTSQFQVTMHRRAQYRSHHIFSSCALVVLDRIHYGSPHVGQVRRSSANCASRTQLEEGRSIQHDVILDDDRVPMRFV